MGYRYTFISDDVPREYPEWFKEKWKESVGLQPLHSREERKYWFPLYEDLQKILKDVKEGEWDEFLIVELGEMGIVNRYKITKDSIEEESLAFDW